MRRRASGTVSRVDRDGTVYAVLESGIETVVEGLTASVNPGDTVNVTIEDGRAVEQGSHDELLAHDGTYARYYRMQFGA